MEYNCGSIVELVIVLVVLFVGAGLLWFDCYLSDQIIFCEIDREIARRKKAIEEDVRINGYPGLGFNFSLCGI